MSVTLPLKKNFGKEIRELSPVLSRQLDEMYTDIANALTYVVRKNILDGSNPISSPLTDQRNTFFSVGDITVRIDTDTAWIMTSRISPEEVVWSQIT